MNNPSAEAGKPFTQQDLQLIIGAAQSAPLQNLQHASELRKTQGGGRTRSQPAAGGQTAGARPGG